MTAIRVLMGLAGLVLIVFAQAQADPPEGDGCTTLCVEEMAYVVSPAMSCWTYDDPVCNLCTSGGRCKGTHLTDSKCEKAGTTKMRQYQPGCVARCDVPLNKAASSSMGLPPQIGSIFDTDLTICTIPLGGGINPP